MASMQKLLMAMAKKIEAEPVLDESGANYHTCPQCRRSLRQVAGFTVPYVKKALCRVCKSLAATARLEASAKLRRLERLKVIANKQLRAADIAQEKRNIKRRAAKRRDAADRKASTKYVRLLKERAAGRKVCKQMRGAE